jgi:hypothetical protein
MTKKGPLSKAEKFYIKSHPDLDIEQLCKDLDRAKATVNEFIKTLPKIPNTSKPQPVEKKETPLSKQFARNDKGGATIMTPNASIMSDDKRSEFRGGTTKRSERCITKIHRD